MVIPGLAADDVGWLTELYHAGMGGDGSGAEGQADRGEAWAGHLHPGQGFEIGIDETDRDTRLALAERLEAFWQRIIGDTLTPHDPLMTSFLMKWPGEDSALPMHQDPTIVDERRARSLSVWVTLVDTDPDLDNGPLYMVPGSHLTGDELRGTGTSPSYYAFLEALWPQAVAVPMKAGDAVFFDARILHGSPPNRSDEPRLALGTSLAPRGTPLVHALARADGDVDLLRVDLDFYRRNSPRELVDHPPQGLSVVEVVPMSPRPYTAETVGSSRRRRRGRSHTRVGT